MSTGILSVKEPFKIFVGDKGALPLSTGYLDKGKTSMKEGTSVVEGEWHGGEFTFPNYWEGWGRRTINGKSEIDDLPVDLTNPKYKGEVEFLDSKDTNGEIIYCRYVKGIQSLDYMYQVNRLNAKKLEDDEQNLLLTLTRGDHKIDPGKDAIYALAIKIHPMNDNSTCKTDRYTTSIYKEVSVMDTSKSNVKEMKVDFQAKLIVNTSSTSFSKLKVLHEILSDSKEIKYDKSDESSLYDVLMMLADENPDEVIRLVTRYKEQVSGVIEKAKSFTAFDTATHGTLYLGGIKKEVLLDKIDAKGEDMIQYLFDNCLEPKSYAAVNRLMELSNTNFK